MGYTFNPLIFSGLDLTGTSSSGSSSAWAAPVATESSLPGSGAVDGETRVSLDTDKVYVWSNSASKWIDTGITSATFGSSPNSAGFSLSTSDVGNIRYRTLILQPANGSNPGGVSTGSQTLAGVKTFSSQINADGGIDRSTSGTLTIGGTNGSIINIGNSGATVNIIGTVVSEQVTNLNVTNKLITMNSGGGAGSGSLVGLQVEENAIQKGYVKTSSDRNSWQLLAPNTAGVATITPGAGGITLDQSSHNPLTLGAVGASPNANAASLSTQVLTLQPADGSNPGVITAGTQTIGGAKTFSSTIAASNFSGTSSGTNTGDQTITLTGDVTGSGIGSFAATIANSAVTYAKIQNVTTNKLLGRATAGSGVTEEITLGTNLAFTGTTLNTTGVAVTSGTLAQFAATTSAQLAGVISDETGTGALVFATSPTLVTPALGTPSSVTLTNATGLPVSTGISGLATGIATFLGTPSSTNLASAITDETGSGALVFATSPTLVTPALGTPSSVTLTNATGLPISTGVSGLATGVATFLGTPTSANLASAITDETGSGALVFANSPTLVTPALGTPSALVGTNITGTASGLTAGNVTTNANSTGDVTSVGNATTVAKIQGTTVSGTTGTGNVVFSASPTITGTITGTTSGNLLKSTGDIDLTSFAAANNQSSATNVTGLAFANASVRAFRALISIFVNATTSLYEVFELLAVQKGASWDMSVESAGDASGFVFTITTAGQVQYTNSNYSGFVSAAVRFRAEVTSV